MTWARRGLALGPVAAMTKSVNSGSYSGFKGKDDDGDCIGFFFSKPLVSPAALTGTSIFAGDWRQRLDKRGPQRDFELGLGIVQNRSKFGTKLRARRQWGKEMRGRGLTCYLRLHVRGEEKKRREGLTRV